MIDNWEYQTDKVAVIPYPSWPNRDGLLGHLYLRTKQDDLLDTVFCGMSGIDFDRFVTYLSRKDIPAQIYCLQEEGKPFIPIGYCFLHSVDGADGARFAMFGFCFFKEYWGREELRDLVWLCLAYWFHAIKVDILYGITLKDNFLARNFSRIFGFEEEAVLRKFLYRQGKRTDARVVLLEKENFQPLYQSWLAKKS